MIKTGRKKTTDFDSFQSIMAKNINVEVYKFNKGNRIGYKIIFLQKLFQKNRKNVKKQDVYKSYNVEDMTDKDLFMGTLDILSKIW